MFTPFQPLPAIISISPSLSKSQASRGHTLSRLSIKPFFQIVAELFSLRHQATSFPFWAVPTTSSSPSPSKSIANAIHAWIKFSPIIYFFHWIGSPPLFCHQAMEFSK